VLPKSLGDERASFRREFDQAYAPVVRILASQKRFFLQAIDRDTDRSRRETYFGTRDVIAQLRRRLLRCQVRRSFSTRPTYQELRFWNIGIFNDPPMRPRFELGVDTTEYWGSTKKFTTVPVVESTLCRYASRQTCMDCSLNSGWKSGTQAGVALPWRGTSNATVEMITYLHKWLFMC